jgi:hypothetical protein
MSAFRKSYHTNGPAPEKVLEAMGFFYSQAEPNAIRPKKFMFYEFFTYIFLILGRRGKKR